MGKNSLEHENERFCCTSKKHLRKAIVVVGPTACGKSSFALDLALNINGVIINADSMQVYQDVCLLTARPTEEDASKAPHCLYGFLNADEKCNAMRWAKLATCEMEKAWDQGKIPIITGGTGLYIQTLMQGISPLPDVPPHVHKNTQELFEKIGAKEFQKQVLSFDPSFKYTDPQRLMRAFDIFHTCGKTLSFWQAVPPIKIVDADYYTVFISPPREFLYQRCNERFLTMFSNGAVEQVKTLLLKNPPQDSFILKAIGVSEIKEYLENKTSQTQAIEHACQMTRNYAKRQITWFKHKILSNQTVLNANDSENLTKVLHFLS